MGDLMKRYGVMEVEMAASLSPSKRRKVDSHLRKSPENSSSASSALAFDLDKKMLNSQQVETPGADFSNFNFKALRKEITPLKATVTPSEAEIEEFFSAAEKYEQKRFSEKYNYDVVKDVPLEGRYQWLKL